MENTPEQDKKTSIIKSLPNNPVLWIIGFFIGTVSSVIGVYSYFFDKKVELNYMVLSNIELIDNPITPKIKVYYDSVKVENIKALTIAFWNSGNEFLSKENIIKDHPITIKSTEPVSILECRMIRVTRPDLIFDMTVNVDDIAGTPTDSTLDLFDYIDLAIRGDEGLEAQDGATFLVLYTGKTECEWEISARIKGVKAGFGKADKPGEFKPKTQRIIDNFMLSLGGIAFIWASLGIDRKFRDKTPDDPNNIFPNIVRATIFLVFCGMCYIWYLALSTNPLPEELFL